MDGGAIRGETSTEPIMSAACCCLPRFWTHDRGTPDRLPAAIVAVRAIANRLREHLATVSA
jgi:hypothetical protein